MAPDDYSPVVMHLSTLAPQVFRRLGRRLERGKPLSQETDGSGERQQSLEKDEETVQRRRSLRSQRRQSPHRLWRRQFRQEEVLLQGGRRRLGQVAGGRGVGVAQQLNPVTRVGSGHDRVNRVAMITRPGPHLACD